MKVVATEIRIINLPFRFAFKHSLASRSYSENIVVGLTLEHNGQRFTGYGEGVPRDYVTGEAVASSAVSLQKDFLPPFRNAEFSDLAELKSLLSSNFRKQRLDERPLGAAWCALELAFFDAYGQAVSQNATQLLGGVSSYYKERAAQSNNLAVRYGAVVPFSSKRLLPGILWFYRLFGFTTVKLKVGVDLEKDLETLKIARSILPPETVIRIDANCGWTKDEAIENLKKMRKFNIASVEQPLAADDHEGLAYLTKNVPEQIVADESLCTISQAKNLAQKKIVSGFNIRISKVGGMLAAAEIAQIAQEHGLGVHLGAQVGESGILSAAARAFALNQPLFANYEGSNNFFLLKNDITQENLNVGPGGYGRSLNGYGFGVNIMPSALDRMTQSKQVLNSDSVLPMVTS